MFFNMLLGHTAETHTDVCTHSRITDMTCFRLHMLDSSAPSSYSSFDGRKNKHLVSHVWLDLWSQKTSLPSSQEQGLESVLPVRELLNLADHEGVACCTSMPLDQASMCPSPRNTHHGDHQAPAPLSDWSGSVQASVTHWQHTLIPLIQPQPCHTAQGALYPGTLQEMEFSGKLRQAVLIRHWHDHTDFRFLLAVVFLSCPTGEGVSFPMFLFTFGGNIDQYGLQLENQSAKPSVLLTTINACSCPEGWDRDPSCERHLNTQTSACLRTRLIYEGAKGAVPMSEQLCFETRPRDCLSVTPPRFPQFLTKPFTACSTCDKQGLQGCGGQLHLCLHPSLRPFHCFLDISPVTPSKIETDLFIHWVI